MQDLPRFESRVYPGSENRLSPCVVSTGESLAAESVAWTLQRVCVHTKPTKHPHPGQDPRHLVRIAAISMNFRNNSVSWRSSISRVDGSHAMASKSVSGFNPGTQDVTETASKHGSQVLDQPDQCLGRVLSLARKALDYLRISPSISWP